MEKKLEYKRPVVSQRLLHFVCNKVNSSGIILDFTELPDLRAFLTDLDNYRKEEFPQYNILTPFMLEKFLGYWHDYVPLLKEYYRQAHKVNQLKLF